METLRIGLVALARTTFDVALAEASERAARARLKDSGLILLGPEGLVTDLPQAEDAALDLAKNAVDALVVLQASFADNSMLVALTDVVKAPVFVWAPPEERNGLRLRLNALSGLNLAAHALRLRGRYYEYAFAPPDSAAVAQRIRALAQAGQVRRRLRGVRLGVIGRGPIGFDNSLLDAPLLKDKLGVQVVPVELERFIGLVRKVEAQTVDREVERAARTVENLNELDPRGVRGTLGAYRALRDLALKENLEGLAVRCWPEFFTEIGGAACGALSLLNDEQMPSSCEADVNGTVTQLILQWLSGAPALGANLVDIDEAQDSAVIWRCGLAPASMAAGPVRGALHHNRKIPLVMAFPLKRGAVTLARLSRASGGLRMVIGRGQMLEAPHGFPGTYGALRFERPADQVLATLLDAGVEHYLSLGYGDHVAALEALARMLGLPILHL